MFRYVTKLLIVLLGVFVAQTAAAQAWTVGEVTPNWSMSTWTPPIATDATHPADTYEPAVDDENGYVADDWIGDYCGGGGTVPCRTSIGVGSTAKFRTECKAVFTKRADAILYRGQYPAGHGHTFFGPTNPYIEANVENFDYNMGREYPGSACQGGPVNTTLYWEPSIYREINGLRLVVIPDNATFYYTLAVADGQNATRLRRDLNFIGGANPSDFNDTARRAEYAAAGYEYPGSTDTAPGFNGVQCYAATAPNTAINVVGDQHKMKTPTGAYYATQARYLVGPNGEDPWDGGCNAPGNIIILVTAPTCWDGTNLHSPNGRDHFRYPARDEDNAPPIQCPGNYVIVPHFETKIFVAHNGWDTDLQYWYLSSDRMHMATTECPDAAAPCDGASGGNVPATVNGVYYSRVSKSPCRSTGVDFCPFETAHFDWWGSWDTPVIEEWEEKCIGMVVGGVDGTYADCGSGGLDVDRNLQYNGASPDPAFSTDPVNITDVDTATDTTEGQRYFPVNPNDQVQGPLDVDVHNW